MALNYHSSMPPTGVTKTNQAPSSKEMHSKVNPVVVSQKSPAAPASSNQGSHQATGGKYTSSSFSPSGDHSGETRNTSSSRNGNGPAFEQTRQGTIEKLLHSYGFINSDVQKEGHLFFHYSEVVGDVNALALGDCVEFHLSYDYRSSRWLAVSVSKVESALTVSKEQFSGQILIKAKPQEKFKNSLDRSGRISYEQSGECFYIPYSTLDLEDEQSAPDTSDKVTFFIATDKKTGHMWATCVKKLTAPPKSQGVVCSLKENFGFIERADVVREIFFHYSEFAGNIAELVLGDDVEFGVQTRNGKEVATNIVKLPEGTVIFEDVNTEKKRGKIGKVIKATRKHAEPLGGSIIYETVDGTKSVPYSERDINGEFTLFVGDIVDFQIAKDRRDGLLHATNVNLCEESFFLSKEKRDRGVVSSVKESYGFLQILSPDSGTGVGDAQLFFHFNELYESNCSPVVVGDEIEFTIAYDPGNKSKPIAIRIRKLAKGTIKQDQVVSSQIYTGTVIQDQAARAKRGSVNGNSNGGGGGSDSGVIRYTANGKEATVPYMLKEADLRYGDKVSFNICEMRRGGGADTAAVKKAVNMKLLSRLGTQSGFVCTLKESYGFIETLAMDDEIFFHYSCCQGDAGDLEIGAIVEYNLVSWNKKVSAENVRKPNQSKVSVEVEPRILSGEVCRTIRPSNSDRETYSGVISQQDSTTQYSFGITSLANKRSAPAVGTAVEFQVAKINGSQPRAVSVMNVKDVVTGQVESLKGSFGFIAVEDREKNVYFNLSDIQDGSTLSVGDMIQCVVVPVVGTNKISAVCIRKLADKLQEARPERLISKLKTQMSVHEGPKLVIIRQPLRPNGETKGFAPRASLQAASKVQIKA